MTGSPVPPEQLLAAKHVVGLDIGDGESALAWSATDPAATIQVYQRKSAKEASILTALSTVRDDQGGRHKTIFGEEAVLARDAVQLFVNFKEPTQEMLPYIQQFAGALINEFFAAYPEVNDNCLIFIGHPTGWDQDAVKAYRRQMSLIGPAVCLLPESQSALVRVRDINHGRTTPLDDVVVIDIGSSTVDVTVVEDLVTRNLKVGQDLGCRSIDLALARLVKEKFARDQEFAEALASSGGEDYLLLACRRAKEAQFAGREQSLLSLREAQNEVYAVITDRGFGWIKTFEILPMVMAPGNWASKFRQLVVEVKQELKRPPQAAIITGGGSRMPFVYDICADAFPDAVVLDADPSLSVARGLVSAARQRVRVARFRRDMSAIVSAPGTRAHVHAQAEDAFGEVKNRLVAVMGRSQATWSELFEAPSDWADKMFSSPNWTTLISELPEGNNVAAELSRSIGDYLIPLTQRVCAAYGIDESRFEINEQARQLFPADLVRRLSEANFRLASKDQLTRVGPMVAQRGIQYGLKEAWAAIRRNPRPDPGWLVTAAVVGAVAGAAVVGEAGINWHTREDLIAKVRNAELPAATAEEIVAETLAVIDRVVEERAQAVERYVT